MRFQPFCDVGRLPRVVEIATPGRAAHREEPGLAGWQLGAVVVRRSVAAYPGTGRPVEPGRMSSPAAEMKMCSISVAPMPSMISTPVASRNASHVAFGRCSPAETAFRRRRDRLPRREHRLVRRGRGEADGHAVLVDQVRELDRRRLLDEQRRRAGVQREQQHAAQPEGEGVGRRAGEHVVGRRPEHVARERLADRHHVAVEVHRRLRPTGRAGGEGEHADVVAGGRHVVERRVLGGEPLGPGVVTERDRRDAERLDGLDEAVVDQGRVEVGDLVDRLQLAGAQQGHRGDQRRRRP